MNQSLLAIVDTGSSFLTLPKKVYTEIIKKKFFNSTNYCTEFERVFPIIDLRIEDNYF